MTVYKQQTKKSFPHIDQFLVFPLCKVNGNNEVLRDEKGKGNMSVAP